MRCQKAQRLMNELSLSAAKVPVDLPLAEHVRNCERCAARAAANEILVRAFKLEKGRTPERETPISFLKTRVESLASHQLKEHKSMSSIKKSLLNHPVMSFGFMGAVVALFLMAVIPVSCSREVGYSLDVGDNDHQIASAITSDAEGTASITFQRSEDNTWVAKELNPQQMIKALESLGIKDAKIDIKANEFSKTFELSGLESREQARDALLAIVEVAGLGGKVEMSTRQASVSGSLLDQFLEGIKELVFDSEGKTDEQVRAEISAALEEAGVFDADVQYSTDEDGRKMIFIGSGSEGDSTVVEQAFKWTADSGGEMIGTPGDSTITIEINSADDGQTVDVEKHIVVDSEN
jgi:hypothetical protein